MYRCGLDCREVSVSKYSGQARINRAPVNPLPVPVVKAVQDPGGGGSLCCVLNKGICILEGN